MKPKPRLQLVPDELDDLSILRAQRGDHASFACLVTRYERPVFALLSRMFWGSQEHLVEDLAQETFLRVFRALPGFSTKGPARLSTWILTIATRLALDVKKKPAFPIESLETASGVRSREKADSRLLRKDLGKVIAEAISSLPPEYRVVFLLREYHDLSYEEIRQALSLDLGTVKSRLSRARNLLRQTLSEVHDG